METSYFGKMKLLMWKQFQLRKRRYISTMLELVLPIVIVFILCKAGAPLVNMPSQHVNESKYDKYAIGSAIQRINVVYAPSTGFARDIMNNVKNLSRNFVKVIELADESHLQLFLSEKRNDSRFEEWFGVVFTNDSTSSETFTYSIRNVDVWYTDDKFPKQEVPGPAYDAYFTKGFAGLQFALDMVYIQSINSKFSTDEYKSSAQFQPFPYPAYNLDSGFSQFIPFVVLSVLILTSIILASPLISSIIEEKDRGLKELMKLVGLEESLIWITWFLNAIVISGISYTIVTFILYYDFGGKGVASINHVSGTVLWSLVMLYCIANITFCFFFAAVFHSTAVASTLIVMSYFGLTYVSYLVSTKQWLFLNQIVCLTPVGALYQGFNRIKYAENHNILLNWLSLSAVEEKSDVSLGFVFLMLLFDICLYSALAYYITMINPGKFGTPKSPFFIFETLTARLKNHNSTHELVNLEDSIDSKYFEKPAANLSVSLQLKDLYKNFGSVQAVRNVNLNIYNGEITALLGHNGAGKTTTMGIMTGTIEPTAGTIIYEKETDVLKQMDKFRLDLGVCPQEDRLFSYLTALEHLTFFGMLKGYTKTDAQNEGRKFLRLMEMGDKDSSLPSDLSGGMKRKLCLAIALMGNAKILILDEPTSGMDVESRRKIWDLLLEWRGTRTILLSTHYMEEADVLGDRIAIMNHGTIVCHGTPIFLKKAYGTGYELTITKSGSSASAFDAIIKDTIPQAEKENEKDDEIVYKLPLTETANFPKLFRNLEARGKDLNIINMGVSCTTMEQVFLKVGGVSIYDLEATEIDSRRKRGTEIDGNLVSGQLEHKKEGLALVTQQIFALLKKRYLYTIRDTNNLFFRVFFHTVLMIVFFRGLVTVQQAQEQPLDLSLSAYPGAKTMLRMLSSSDVCANLKQSFTKNGIQIVDSNQSDIVDAMLDYAKDDLRSFRTELMFGFNCDSAPKVVLYNRLGWHTLPVMINTWSNAILRQFGNHQIVAVNHPINKITPTCESSDYSTEASMYVTYYIAFAFISVELINYFSIYLCVERVDGFKHIQFMSNLSPFVYWWGTWIWDATFFMVVFVLRIFVFKIFDYYDFLAFDSHLAVFVFLAFIFAFSGTMFQYVTNYIASSKSRSTTLISILNVICVIAVGIYYMYLFFSSKSQEFDSIYLSILKYVILLTPIFNYPLIVVKFVAIWINNTKCMRCNDNAMRASCEQLHRPQSYLEFASPENVNGLLGETLYLVLDVFLWAGLLIFIQTGYLARLWNFITKKLISGADNNKAEEEDADVKIERDAVRLLTASTGQQPNDYRNTSSNAVLLVDGLKKIFIRLKWFRPLTAVSDVTFAVKPGQCFGLLGVNGAGKSTTFKMLTTYILPTAGDASIMNVKMSENKTTYLTKIGYCAQTNAFIEELSGREMLTLTASLRGVQTNRVKTLVNKWISIVGLESYQNRQCGTYSGGNKRKLCTAMSLIGDPHVVFLDEPTTGVDPVSRRKLYDVMEQSKRSGQAVVLSSHSMEECENLCDRLTIMSKGRMKCIGTVQHLKQRYAQGFSILIKIKDAASGYSLVDNIKRDFMRTFRPDYSVLKDEHKGLLYYQITDKDLLWSTLFEKMERIKSENSIIEDYTICDTSLEEVFISFAKQAKA